uniref:Uncharacterized protein n=1 Tax=Arundo donax TaxID=35708 RepID=A0A0A9GWS2_ARUDO
MNHSNCILNCCFSFCRFGLLKWKNGSMRL